MIYKGTGIPNYVWEFVKQWEGGSKITNHQSDTGGVTKYGISSANNKDIDVVNLTEHAARQLYKTRYWDKANCNDLPIFMRLIQFNCSVNCGQGTARKILQRVVGAKADGKVGIKTRAKIAAFGDRPKIFAINYLTFQALYYFNIVERRQSQHIWLKGWLRRTFDAGYTTATKVAEAKQ